MPALTTSQFATEHRAPDNICGPARAVWISEPAGLSQHGAVGGDRETLLHPGEAAAFKACVPTAHYLVNRSDRPARCLVVGTRAPVDRIVKPDHDRICVRDRSQPCEIWTDFAGGPASNTYA